MNSKGSDPKIQTHPIAAANSNSSQVELVSSSQSSRPFLEAGCASSNVQVIPLQKELSIQGQSSDFDLAYVPNSNVHQANSTSNLDSVGLPLFPTASTRPTLAVERVHRLRRYPLHRIASFKGRYDIQHGNSTLPVTVLPSVIEISVPLSSDVLPVLPEADLSVANEVGEPSALNLEPQPGEAIQQISCSSSEESVVFDHRSVRDPNISTALDHPVEQRTIGSDSESSIESPATHSTPNAISDMTQ